MKRLIILLLILALTIPSFAVTYGELSGSADYTDIGVYIGNSPIRSYTIDNRIVIPVESLSRYGFDVVWDGKKRALTVNLNADKPYGTDELPGLPVGCKAGDSALNLFTSDISVFLDSVKVKSWNAGDVTLIRLDDFAKAYGAEYLWYEQSRKYTVTPVTEVPNTWLRNAYDLTIPMTAPAQQLSKRIRTEGERDTVKNQYSMTAFAVDGMSLKLTYQVLRRRIYAELVLDAGGIMTDITLDLTGDSQYAWRVYTERNDGYAVVSGKMSTDDISSLPVKPAVSTKNGDSDILKSLEGEYSADLLLINSLVKDNIGSLYGELMGLN